MGKKNRKQPEAPRHVDVPIVNASALKEADACMRIGSAPGVVAALARACGNPGSFQLVLKEYCNRAIEEGKADFAESCMLEGTRAFPELWSLRGDVGSFLIQRGNYSGAIAQFEAVLKQKPDEGIAMYMIGVAWHNLGDFTKAEKWARSSMAVYKKFEDPYFLLGMIAESRGDFPNARSFFEEYLKRKPDSHAAWVHVLVIATAASDHELVERASREAVRRDEARSDFDKLLMYRIHVETEVLKVSGSQIAICYQLEVGEWDKDNGNKRIAS